MCKLASIAHSAETAAQNHVKADGSGWYHAIAISYSLHVLQAAEETELYRFCERLSMESEN